MNSDTTSAQLDDVDALIAEMETEITHIAELAQGQALTSNNMCGTSAWCQTF